MHQPVHQSCPVCKCETPFYSNHPNYVCKACVEKYPILNKKGEEVRFFNVSHTGGFYAKVLATGETNDDHICFINGVKCWADEFRFGGIVIEAIE